jgi:hypothetical protein
MPSVVEGAQLVAQGHRLIAEAMVGGGGPTTPARPAPSLFGSPTGDADDEAETIPVDLDGDGYPDVFVPAARTATNRRNRIIMLLLIGAVIVAGLVYWKPTRLTPSWDSMPSLGGATKWISTRWNSLWSPSPELGKTQLVTLLGSATTAPMEYKANFSTANEKFNRVVVNRFVFQKLPAVAVTASGPNVSLKAVYRPEGELLYMAFSDTAHDKTWVYAETTKVGGEPWPTETMRGEMLTLFYKLLATTVIAPAAKSTGEREQPSPTSTQQQAAPDTAKPTRPVPR